MQIIIIGGAGVCGIIDANVSMIQTTVWVLSSLLPTNDVQKVGW